jgi:hypothetical protein
VPSHRSHGWNCRCPRRHRQQDRALSWAAPGAPTVAAPLRLRLEGPPAGPPRCPGTLVAASPHRECCGVSRWTHSSVWRGERGMVSETANGGSGGGCPRPRQGRSRYHHHHGWRWR